MIAGQNQSPHDNDALSEGILEDEWDEKAWNLGFRGTLKTTVGKFGREAHAAGRAAERLFWAERLENNARAIRNITQKFQGDPIMAQTAKIRAEALEDQATAIRSTDEEEKEKAR